MPQKNKKKMNNILIKLAFAGILFLIAATNATAQRNKNKRQNDEITAIHEQLRLVAEKMHPKNGTKYLDSLRLKRELTEEGESPADEIYEGAWNNEFLKVYAGAEIPDSFRIDVSSFIMPITGYITSPYGPRWNRFHYGTDIKLQTGDTVYSAFDGKVRVCSYERKGYGNYLVIRHPNGLETVYGHLSKTLVKINETVAAGQPIALGGNTGRSTGSHLHFEFRFLGQAIDPSDIIDFSLFCTYDDYYVFHKSRSGNSYYNREFYTQFKDTEKQRFSNSRIKYHRVRNGETLLTVARKYGMSVETLCRLNRITTTTTLKVGQSLRCS
jgi:murein DD-endopeptidase MepM/ murein hydrolase activator NlpD